jgi:hypothetical protein
MLIQISNHAVDRVRFMVDAFPSRKSAVSKGAARSGGLIGGQK